VIERTGRPAGLADRQIALVDLLDRLLAGGVVLTGDLVVSIADVDLVRISLRALITSVNEETGFGEEVDTWPRSAPT
jgi:hypothetical protein